MVFTRRLFRWLLSTEKVPYCRTASFAIVSATFTSETMATLLYKLADSLYCLQCNFAVRSGKAVPHQLALPSLLYSLKQMTAPVNAPAKPEKY